MTFPDELNVKNPAMIPPNGLAETINSKSDVFSAIEAIRFTNTEKSLFVYRETARGVNEREFAKWVGAAERQCYCGSCMFVCFIFGAV